MQVEMMRFNKLLLYTLRSSQTTNILASTSSVKQATASTVVSLLQITTHSNNDGAEDHMSPSR